MDNRPIGIFDSGVGGLSVLQEIKKILPKENYVFLADQANVPYGAKNKKELEHLTHKIVSFLLKNDAKIIVAACNTATVYALSYLREKFDIPIIGTVPVVKTLVKLSKNKKGITFSTPATAKSPYLKDLIEKFAPDMTIYKVGGGELEELVEKGEVEGPEVETIIRRALMPAIQEGADVVALSCTHYPFLKNKIQKIVGKNIMIVDSGEAVAARVKFVLEQENLLSNNVAKSSFFTTGNADELARVAKKLLGYKLDQVYKAEL